MNRFAVAAFAAFATVLSAIIFAGGAFAQQADFSKVEIKTTDLGNQTYMLEGQGGNITVAVGGDGIIMVDGEFAPLHDKIKAAITAISPKPIEYLINTHYHGDHTGGNAPFTKDGVRVVAQENVGKRLAAGTTNGMTGAKTPPAEPGALPAMTYKDILTLGIKGRTAKLFHPKNAHTDGDTGVLFKDANVLATGDIVTLGRFPNIDFANGGSIGGMISGVDSYIKQTNASTKVVPGHGPLSTRKDMIDYREMLKTCSERIGKLIADGKTEDQAVAAKPFADIAANLKADDAAAATFVKVVYRSLKTQKA